VCSPPRIHLDRPDKMMTTPTMPAGLAATAQAQHVHLVAQARPAAALDQVRAALQVLDARFVLVVHGEEPPFVS
jgi:hypothetical protein